MYIEFSDMRFPTYPPSLDVTYRRADKLLCLYALPICNVTKQVQKNVNLQKLLILPLALFELQTQLLSKSRLGEV
jgi:hypothetical protein